MTIVEGRRHFEVIITYNAKRNSRMSVKSITGGLKQKKVVSEGFDMNLI
jgi:hypothetical protein